MPQPLSFTRACLDYFGTEPYGRKVEIVELKALTDEDKAQLKEWLIAEGYEIDEFAKAA